MMDRNFLTVSIIGYGAIWNLIMMQLGNILERLKKNFGICSEKLYARSKKKDLCDLAIYLFSLRPHIKI